MVCIRYYLNVSFLKSKMKKQIYGGRFVSVPSKLPDNRLDLIDTPFPYKDKSLEEAVSNRRVYVHAKNADQASLLMIGVYAQRKNGWIPKKSRSRESVIVARYIGTLDQLGIKRKVKVSKIE